MLQVRFFELYLLLYLPLQSIILKNDFNLYELT